MEDHSGIGRWAFNSSNAINGATLSPTKQDSTFLMRLNSIVLQEHDRESIRYSKGLLADGDTLVFIEYPSSPKFYDHTGFPLKEITDSPHEAAPTQTGIPAAKTTASKEYTWDGSYSNDKEEEFNFGSDSCEDTKTE